MKYDTTAGTHAPVSEIEEQLNNLDGSINRLAEELDALFDQIRPVTKVLPPAEGGDACSAKPIPGAPQSSIGVAVSLLRSKTDRLLSEVTVVKANLAI